MTALSLSPDTLTALRQRRAAGERVSLLAAEVGVPWQKLDKALRHLSAPPAPEVPLTPSAAVGPLTERYRPRSLEAILGQPSATRLLKRFVASPRPMAFLFEGETGTGKTSAALALAAELGCAVEHGEFGGVWTIASGEQSADAVRETCSHLHCTPMAGSGWKVLIVNEADRMNPAAETIWLDRLENVPSRCVVIFTTNFSGKLSSRFRDRCVRITFVADPKRLTVEAGKLAAEIWRRETGKPLPIDAADSVLTAAVEDGKFSFRRLVQALQVQLMEGGAL